MIQGLIDIHCHIVPGVDDGAPDRMAAAKLLQAEYRNGVTAVIATPHYRRGMFEPTQEEVEKGFAEILRMTRNSRSGLRAFLGCEYHTSAEMAADIREKRRPTMAGSRYVLAEFSSAHPYSVIRNQVYQLVAEGYVPILAHIERYPCLVKKPELVRDLMELGAQMQLTSSSVLGKSGWQIRRFCGRMLKERCISYIATDAHDLEERKPDLQECAVYLEKKYDKRFMEQILIRNPRKIIMDGKENR